MVDERIRMPAIAASLLLLLLAAGCVRNAYFGSGSATRNYCNPEQRGAQVCITIYQPACGWFDPAAIQCVRYPCAATYSNSCFACMDEKVLYWTDGECPK